MFIFSFAKKKNTLTKKKMAAGFNTSLDFTTPFELYEPGKFYTGQHTYTAPIQAYLAHRQDSERRWWEAEELFQRHQIIRERETAQRQEELQKTLARIEGVTPTAVNPKFALESQQAREALEKSEAETARKEQELKKEEEELENLMAENKAIMDKLDHYPSVIPDQQMKAWEEDLEKDRKIADQWKQFKADQETEYRDLLFKLENGLVYQGGYNYQPDFSKDAPKRVDACAPVGKHYYIKSWFSDDTNKFTMSWAGQEYAIDDNLKWTQDMRNHLDQLVMEFNLKNSTFHALPKYITGFTPAQRKEKHNVSKLILSLFDAFPENKVLLLCALYAVNKASALDKSEPPSVAGIIDIAVATKHYDFVNYIFDLAFGQRDRKRWADVSMLIEQLQTPEAFAYIVMRFSDYLEWGKIVSGPLLWNRIYDYVPLTAYAVCRADLKWSQYHKQNDKNYDPKKIPQEVIEVFQHCKRIIDANPRKHSFKWDIFLNVFTQVPRMMFELSPKNAKVEREYSIMAEIMKTAKIDSSTRVDIMKSLLNYESSIQEKDVQIGEPFQKYPFINTFAVGELLKAAEKMEIMYWLRKMKDQPPENPEMMGTLATAKYNEHLRQMYVVLGKKWNIQLASSGY